MNAACSSTSSSPGVAAVACARVERWPAASKPRPRERRSCSPAARPAANRPRPASRSASRPVRAGLRPAVPRGSGGRHQPAQSHRAHRAGDIEPRIGTRPVIGIAVAVRRCPSVAARSRSPCRCRPPRRSRSHPPPGRRSHTPPVNPRPPVPRPQAPNEARLCSPTSPVGCHTAPSALHRRRLKKPCNARAGCRHPPSSPRRPALRIRHDHEKAVTHLGICSDPLCRRFARRLRGWWWWW